MENKIEVSIIVPIYNTETYLDRCIQSLVHQTLKDIEIVLVNDGSKDSSIDICKRYQQQFPEKIVIVDKKNGGLSDARNAGIDVAKGNYIGFVDSDDYVDIEMYQMMLNKAKENSFDLVVCDLDYIYEDHIKPAYSHIKEDMFYEDDVKKSLTYIYPAAWNKLYKKELFDKSGIRFTKGIWFEDVEFIHRLYPYLHSIGTVHRPFYKYIQREGSIMTVFDERLFDYIKNWKNIISYHKENGFYEKYKCELEYCCVRYLYATFLKAAAKYPNKADYKKAVHAAKEMIHTYFPKYRRNKYFYKNGVKGLYLVLFNETIANLIYMQLRKQG